MSSTIDHRALRDVFGTFPTGVVAVAGEVEGSKVGFAASSFTSVSIDPPLVSFAVAKSSTTWPALRQSDELGISVLAQHHDVTTRQLAGPAERRFKGVSASTHGAGAVLLEDAVAGLRTRVHAEVEAGDHLIVLLEVLEIVVVTDREPLVFHRSGFKCLHRDNLDPSDLQGRINGAPVGQAS